jgi:hypothetical protein
MTIIKKSDAINKLSARSRKQLLASRRSAQLKMADSSKKEVTSNGQSISREQSNGSDLKATADRSVTEMETNTKSPLTINEIILDGTQE